MNPDEKYLSSSVLVVGAGPAGLATAITIKKHHPDTEVCVIDKAAGAGNHNLSGAVLEEDPLHELLEMADPQWRESEQARKILCRRVEKDDILMLLGKDFGFSMMPFIHVGKWMRLGFGEMIHKGDYIVSISELTHWLSDLAESMGVEVLYGFAAEDIVMATENCHAAGVKLVDQGLNHEGKPQLNYVPGEIVNADMIVLAEGCDGLVTESFVQKAGLRREATQLYSVGVKELIEVRPEQYEKFGDNRVVHAMGYPIWTPMVGPGMFGGGIMYPCGDNRIAVGMIVGADWKYHDFNPQDALVRFKQHRFVKQFIEGGTVVEAGAKMIPEGGYYAVPRDPATNTIGKSNVMILGDSAGFVNMNKIKGLHNALSSGIAAGRAVTESLKSPQGAAARYTEMVMNSPVEKEMWKARKFRQTVAKFGNSLGFPLSSISPILPRFDIEKDSHTLTPAEYKNKCEKEFDKDGFTAAARVEHREEQPCHCEVFNPAICEEKCAGNFNRACITFCPAGVYELIDGRMKPANPSNCLHCKTCQNKCPYDNLKWHAPEGSGGPKYLKM